MNKRTIIIAIVAVLAFAAALFSLWFEYKSTIAEAKAIIDGIEPDEPVKRVYKTREPKQDEPIKQQEDENNANGIEILAR